MTLRAVDPKVLNAGIIPVVPFEGDLLSPQQLTALGSKITFKQDDIEGLIREAKKRAAKEGGVNLEQQMRLGAIASAARGHASMTTSVVFAAYFSGVSKFIDTMFTGTRFGSSIMPSGRNIGVELENIVAPISIVSSTQEVQSIYEEQSRSNLFLYQRLQEEGIPKQEAAKITQYGIDGGGSMILPLETLISFRQEMELEDKGHLPTEWGQIVSALEEPLDQLGAEFLYQARLQAPSSTFPHLHPFKDPRPSSFVGDLEDSLIQGMIEERFELNTEADFDRRATGLKGALRNLLEMQEATFKDPTLVRDHWRKLKYERQRIARDYQEALKLTSFMKMSWRVQGELKRHRATPQQVGSIYRAIDKAINTFSWLMPEIDALANGTDLPERAYLHINNVFEIPESLRGKGPLLGEYLMQAKSSLYAYTSLVERGVPVGDALYVVPRGLKLPVYKETDLWDLLVGCTPLRTCGTAEPEMQRLSNLEANAARQFFIEEFGEEYEKLIGPKCHPRGYCPETWKKCCRQVDGAIDFKYTREFHEEMERLREKAILDQF